MKTAAQIVEKLLQLAPFPEDGCGSGVVSLWDINALLEWAQDDEMTDEDLQKQWDDRDTNTVHYGTSSLIRPAVISGRVENEDE